MRAYCYTCQDDTIVHANGTCGFCNARIINPHKQSRHAHIGGHSYIGTEAFYRACYDRYLEVRSIRKVAAEVWEQAGYASPASCWNTLHEAWLVRGWPTYARGYANMQHGKTRRSNPDAAHKRSLRVKRGEIRDVKCAGTRSTRPGLGDPCRMYALRGSAYCRYHDPERRDQVVEETRRMRAARGVAA